MTHRIAVDLLVEVSKRVELRRPIVEAGIVGTALALANAYARVLLDANDDIGKALAEKIRKEHSKYAHDMKHPDGFKPEVVLNITSSAWCPFELEGERLLSSHILLSVLRIFAEISEEDKFRSASEFTEPFHRTISSGVSFLAKCFIERVVGLPLPRPKISSFDVTFLPDALYDEASKA